MLTHAATVTYEYDDLGRLRKVTYENGVKTNYTLDQAGNRTVVVTSDDTTAPPIPTGFAGTPSATPSVTLTWNESIDTGSSGTGGYKIFREGTLIAEVPGRLSLTYVDTTVLGSTTYHYSISAYDNAENESAQLNPPITVVTPNVNDGIKPTKPTQLTGTPASMTQVNLKWTGSTDAGGSGLAGYRIYRATQPGGASQEIGTSATTTYNDGGATGNTSYLYRVAAYDRAGNISDQSDPFFITTPSVPAGSLGFTGPVAVSVREDAGFLELIVERTGGTWSEASVKCGGVSGTGSSPAIIGADFSSASTTLTWAAAETAAKACRIPIVNDSLGEGYYLFVEGAGNIWLAQETFNAQLTEVSGATLANASVLVTIEDEDPLDTVSPSAPTNLASNAVSPTRVDLTWTASTDNVKVTQYRVERCAGAGCTNFANYDGSTTASYSDVFAAASTVYRYRVIAMDARGNSSGYSNITAVTTPDPPDTTPPSAVQNLAANAPAHNQVVLTWVAATDNVGVTGYSVERCAGASCSNFSEIATPATPGYTDNAVTANTSYTYRVRAKDLAVNWGPYTGASVTTPLPPDVTPPSATTGLSANAVAHDQVDLQWAAATDDRGVTNYLVERCTGSGCSSFVEIAQPTGITYSDPTAVGSTTYTYRVRARDAANNRGGYSNTAVATTPAPPIGGVEFPSPTVVTVNESAGFVELTIVRTSNTFLAVSLSCTASSGGVNPASAGADFSPTPVTVSWSAGDSTPKICRIPIVNDSLGEGYYMFVQGAGNIWLAQESFNVTLSNVSGATLGNASAIVTINDDDPFDTTAPSAPTNLSAGTVSTTQINLSWTPSTDDVGVTGYRIERCAGSGCTNFVNYDGSPTASYSDVFASPSTAYRYRVFAGDARGNISGYSNIASATTLDPPDTTPPTPPSVSASAISHVRVDVSFSGATDNRGVTGYSLERCTGASCSSFGEIATPGSSPYTDISVSPQTAYNYRMRARDAAGLWSSYSNVASVTTPAPPDTAAPDVPTGLTATATVPFRVDLGWGGSTDTGGSGLAGYRVYRFGSYIGSTTGTNYSDSTVSPNSSYSYTVTAYDNANNESGQSNTASATTPQNAPPGAPSWITPCSSDCTQPAGTPGTRNISISWGAVANATSYSVEYGLFLGCGEFCWTLVWSPLTTTSSTSTTYLANIPSTVWLRVQACNAYGCSGKTMLVVTYQ